MDQIKQNPIELEKPKQILRKRAERLAKPLDDYDFAQDSEEILIFNMSKERYGIELKYIKEVYPLKQYTKIPSAPSFLFGLINLRRKILPVIDLRVIFAVPQAESQGKKVIIIQGEGREFALLCDTLIGIQKFTKDNLHATLVTLTGVKQEFLKGVTGDGIAILDSVKLLKSDKLVVDQTG